MSPGIPPSPERQERQRIIVGSAVVMSMLFLLLLYLVVFRPVGGGGARMPNPGGTSEDRLEAYLAEEERASAYQALRDHMDQKKREPDISAVFCRDSSHQWVGETIEFRGDVDFERPDGRLERHAYYAVLSGSKADGWEVLSVEVTPVRR